MSEWHIVILNELETRGWTLGAKLVSFEQNVLDELQADAVDPAGIHESHVRRATVRCYARHLFEKCGGQDSPEHRRAYLELWAYLYPRAVFRLHEAEEAKDATQQTLIKIFEKRTTCRDPGSFLRWSEQILIFTIADRFREKYGRRMTERTGEAVERAQPLDARNDAESEADGADAVIDPRQDTPRAALRGPMREALVAVLRHCLANERYIQVIASLFLAEKNFSELAQELHTTQINIQVMRTRALQKLRDCPEMQKLVEDWDQ